LGDSGNAAGTRRAITGLADHAVSNGLVELLIGSDIDSEGEEDEEEDDREAFDDVHVS
jgi:hypothetical protein